MESANSAPITVKLVRELSQTALPVMTLNISSLTTNVFRHVQADTITILIQHVKSVILSVLLASP